MPIPSPSGDESQEEFVSRCMGDASMQEYDEKQRAAICYDAWGGDKGLLVSQEQFHQRVSLGLPRHVIDRIGVYRVSTGDPEIIDDSRKVRFCFSDGTVDRMGDTIDPAGWDFRDFMRNPVALWAHDSSAPPIGRASNVGVAGQRLMGDIEFAAPETYAFADTIYRLVTGGFIKAVSVGFLPKDYDRADDKDRRGGLDFKRQELLEISVVPVPANAHALVEARAKGIDTRPVAEWVERVLDGEGRVSMSKAELEKLRKAALSPAVPKRKPVTTTTFVERFLDKADGMSEGDPAAGGAFVGNCGRPGDKECGMKDKSECSIHGFGGAGVSDNDADDNKRLAALIQREVALAITVHLPAAVKAAMKPRRRADDDDGDDDDNGKRPDVGGDEHEKNIRLAHMHVKAADDAHEVAGDHLDNAMKALSAVKEALDAEPPSDDGLDPGDNPEAEKAAQRAIVDARRARLRSA